MLTMPISTHHFIRLFLFLSFLLALSSHANEFNSGYQIKHKVIAAGDIRRAYSQFEQLLKELNLIDEDNNWSVGN